MKLSPEKNIHKKSNSFFNINSRINGEQKNTSFTTTSANINSKDISGVEIPKKIENVFDFINQKNKFNIDNIFDGNGAKDFLASKEKAMMEIKLDDERTHKKKKKNSTVISMKSSAIDLKNEGDTKSKNEINKKAATIISKEDKHNNINYKKENRKKYRNSKYKNKEKNNDQGSEGDNDNILIIDELNDHSKESNYFYKFIIDHANDSEDEFQKKLEKVIKKAENKRRKSKNERKSLKDKKRVVEENNDIFRCNSVKNIKKRDTNIFVYSEQVKTLMENEDIDISSIDSSEKNIHKNHSMKNNIKINKKNIFLGEKEKKLNDDKKNIIFGEKEKKFIDDKKDSLVSFLDELMQK